MFFAGNEFLAPGAPVGNGLTPEAAKDLGLSEGVAVAASLIDAHAGGLGIPLVNNYPCFVLIFSLTLLLEICSSGRDLCCSDLSVGVYSFKTPT